LIQGGFAELNGQSLHPLIDIPHQLQDAPTYISILDFPESMYQLILFTAEPDMLQRS
jgi:hypothetical protein